MSGAWTQSGDGRDDRLLTRALAVLGLTSLRLTGLAAVAVGVGGNVPMVLTLLLVAQALVLAVAFLIHSAEGEDVPPTHPRRTSGPLLPWAIHHALRLGGQ